MSLRPDYDDMRDFQYAEENPGYQREIGLTSADLGWGDPDYDPEIAMMVADKYAYDNSQRREKNLRTEISRLRAVIEEHGIEIPEEN